MHTFLLCLALICYGYNENIVRFMLSIYLCSSGLFHGQSHVITSVPAKEPRGKCANSTVAKRQHTKRVTWFWKTAWSLLGVLRQHLHAKLNIVIIETIFALKMEHWIFLQYSTTLRVEGGQKWYFGNIRKSHRWRVPTIYVNWSTIYFQTSQNHKRKQQPRWKHDPLTSQHIILWHRKFLAWQVEGEFACHLCIPLRKGQ